MNFSTVARWLAITWTIIILIGCLTPHEDVPGTLMTWNDKVLHIAIFVPFSLLWILAGFRRNNVVVAGFFLGALIEALQYVLPINRSADAVDLLADCLGVAIGAVLALAWYRLFPKS
ncbi:VanZ family protein [Spirosoma koreense]